VIISEGKTDEFGMKNSGGVLRNIESSKASIFNPALIDKNFTITYPLPPYSFSIFFETGNETYNQAMSMNGVLFVQDRYSDVRLLRNVPETGFN